MSNGTKVRRRMARHREKLAKSGPQQEEKKMKIHIRGEANGVHITVDQIGGPVPSMMLPPVSPAEAFNIATLLWEQATLASSRHAAVALESAKVSLAAIAADSEASKVAAETKQPVLVPDAPPADETH